MPLPGLGWYKRPLSILFVRLLPWEKMSPCESEHLARNEQYHDRVGYRRYRDGHLELKASAAGWVWPGVSGK